MFARKSVGDGAAGGGGGGGGGGGQQRGGGGAYVGKATRPVTIKQLHSAQQIGDGSPVVDGVEVGHVIIQGRVIEAAVNSGAGGAAGEQHGGQAKNFSYLISDGTGIIAVRDWVSSNTGDDALLSIGSFASVVGTVKMVSGVATISGSVTAQTDNNEFIFHLLSCVVTHLRLTQGEQDQPQKGAHQQQQQQQQHPAAAGGGQHQHQQQQHQQHVNHFANVQGGAAAAAMGGAAAAAQPVPDMSKVTLAGYKTLVKMGQTFNMMEILSTVRSMPALGGTTPDQMRAFLQECIDENNVAHGSARDTYMKIN